ncbi:hypothetical protein NRK67_04925 [Fusobacteria bacterium ZRK30]|nr:hypothetical protein NRK67_04925 [Fusobacteria bacterium ZRK30]
MLKTFIFLNICLLADIKFRKEIPLLRKISFPSLFFMGIFISFFDVYVDFPREISKILLTLFFATIGLRYSKKTFFKGLKWQLMFLIFAVLAAVFQNLFIKLIDYFVYIKDIKIYSSLMFMGDLSLISKYSSHPSISGMETLTVILGTVFCSLFFGVISKDKKLYIKKMEKTETKNVFIPVVIIFVITILSLLLEETFLYPLKSNGIAYILGLLFRWKLDKGGVYLENFHINKIGNYFLSLFILLKFSSLDIKSLGILTLSDILIVFLQIMLLILFSIFFVYRVYRGKTLAVFLSTAILGFGIGIPPSTMSVLQQAGKEKGTPCHMIMIVPVVGAWLITYFNPIISKFFLN